MMSKNKMHACLMGTIAAAIVTVGTWGSMQYVFAQSPALKAKIEVSDGKRVAEKGAVIEIKIDQTGEGKSTVTNDSNKVKSIAGIPCEKLVMANVEEAVNVRADASEEAALVGKLYKECGGTILEQGSDWTKIKSGELTGWVKNDYLLFGKEAISLAEKSVEKTATSTTDCLRVRKEASEDAGVYGLLALGDEIEAIEEQGDWVKVAYADGDIGYVASRYVKVSDELQKGETIASIKAKEEALKKEREAAKKEQKSENKSDAKSAPTPTNNGAIAGDVNDVQLLASLIQAEAGNECYEGQVSVGTVVMNRLRTGRYSNIYSVIYAKGQFGPAASGKVASIYANGPKASCLQAAQDAMNGVSYIGTATKFRNVRSGAQGIVVGNHVFW